MMILEVGEVCPYASSCPHNNNHVISTPCYGTLTSRQNQFTCQFVVNGSIVKDNVGRIPGDQTGKMKVILE